MDNQNPKNIPTPENPRSVEEVYSLPNPTDILSQTMTLYWRRHKIFSGIVLIPLLVNAMASIFRVLTHSVDLLTLISNFSMLQTIGVISFIVIFIVIGGFFQLASQTALIYSIKDSVENIGVVESYMRGHYKMFSYWWIMLLSGLIVLGGLFLLVIPGILFLISIIFASFILIVEDIKGIEAILKSREYVRGQWLGLFMQIFFFGFICVIVFLISSTIFNGLGLYFSSFAPYAGTANSFVLGLFLIPLTTIYLFLLYLKLRAIRGEEIFIPTRGQEVEFFGLALFGFLGILVTGAITVLVYGLIFSRKESRDEIRKKNISTIEWGLKTFHEDQHKYPAMLGDLSPKYLNEVPTDPSLGKDYNYHSLKGGKDYKLCTDIEASSKVKCYTSLTDTEK